MDYHQTMAMLKTKQTSYEIAELGAETKAIESMRMDLHLQEVDNTLDHLGDLLRHHPQYVKDAYAALMDAYNLGEEK